MYESFYGLTRRPFAATPDADCFVPVDTMQQALTELLLCLHGGQGVAVLSAPAGTGKTLLCRKVAVELQDAFRTAMLPSANFPTRRSLLQAVLYELQHPYARMTDQELRLELTTALRQICSTKQGLVLILDEAHLLSERLFEELRGITNLAHIGEPLVRVLLSGQLSLEEKLMSPALAAFNHRVACQVTLQPLTRLESAEYIRHRLNWAGGQAAGIFTREAVQLIGHASDGLPRCLNQLCDHSLLLGYVAEEQPVGATTVREALQDLKQLPLHWNEPAPIAAPLDQLKQHAGERHVAPPGAEADEPAEAPETTRPRPPAATERHEPASAQPDAYGAGDLVCFEVGGEPSAAAEAEPLIPPSTAATSSTNESAAASCSTHIAGAERHVEAAEPESEVADQRPESAERLFEEELVVDRYAMLESGLPLEDTGRAETDAADGEAAMAVAPVDADDLACERPDALEEEIAEADVERMLDDILPLIDQALRDDGEVIPPQPSIREFEMPEPLPPPSWAADVVETGPSGDEQCPGIELEDEIGATVLDACVQVQQRIERRTEEFESAAEGWIDTAAESWAEAEPLTRSESPGQPEASPPGEPHLPFGNAARRRRQYERLFSELRRHRRGA